MSNMFQLAIAGNKTILEKIEQQIEAMAVATTLVESWEDATIWTLTIISEQKIKSIELSKLSLKTDQILFNDLLPDRDWVAENRASFKPILLKDFYIYPSSNCEELPTDKINLCIDASTAFGTGHHETTAGCLAALSQLKEQNFQPNHFLDIGTGTGILAMAAARLFDVNGVATDNDLEAIERTIHNLNCNMLTKKVYPVLDGDLSAREVNFFNPYPLIMANILLKPLLTMASSIVDYLQEGGYLILSGILETQAMTLQQAYLDHNLKLINQIILGDWSIFILKK